ncbi:hypothetical protein DENSPDRAFT_476953 [Dentipellis sp. KUC8613]|nr:hypothetical protein DENSPDRAFT_476953 [Dentipellis sp. KUC8613]
MSQRKRGLSSTGTRLAQRSLYSMIFDPSTADSLKPWLTRTLEPICDADPDALADYILALLKHNAPENELRKELVSQLEEFLEKEGPPFIDTLFTALRTKSYLPYGTSSPPATPSHTQAQPIQTVDNGIPIPLDALLGLSNSVSPDRSRKRGPDYDDQDGRPPKGPRLSNERWGNGAWDGRGPRPRARGDVMDGGMVMGGGMNGMGYRQEQKRGICRDYHNNGYCARGAFCKFSHGEDAFVPNQMFPMNSQQMQGNMFMPMFQNGMPFAGMNGGGPSDSAPYNPHEARLDMRPQGGMGVGPRQPPRAPMLARGRIENGDRPGELPVIQDLTPQEPKEGEKAPVNGHRTPGHVGPNGDGPSGQGAGPTPSSTPMDVDSAAASGGHHQQHSYPQRGMRPMRGRGAPGPRPGYFGGEVQRFRPERRNDKTLVVEKIPEDRLSLDSVNGWFKQFGTVTNVAIDAGSAKALVSFETHEAAHAAWKSEEAVFGNRFVKVFWHRPMEGHGQVGQRMLAASAPLVANISARENAAAASAQGEHAASPAPSTPAHQRKSSTPAANATKSALAAKQQLLEQQIAEQKSLMEKLSTASPEEKKTILARLRKLGEEMKAPAASPSTPRATTPVPAQRRASSTPKAEEHEQKERERLDKELEMHAAVVEGEEDSTEALKAKLEKLKAEAASLGIDANAEPQYGSTSYRPYRGRGRGSRGYFRGAMRGGPPRGSMKLDNRPKKLLVKDVSPDAVQAVRDWYEPGGQMESVETLEGGDVVVTFRTRAAAEQGLAKGPHIPVAGHKQISWYTGTASAHPPVAKPAIAKAGADGGLEEHPASAESRDVHAGEEEPVVSGWGADGDEDGFGML